MPELLCEYWEDEDGGQFGPVSEHSDRIRSLITRSARFVFSLHASSSFEAMQLYQEKLGYGDYVPPEGVPNHFYTSEEVAEQEAYLLVRSGR